MQQIGNLSYVLCDLNRHPWRPHFHSENRSFPNSFWQNKPLLWVALKNNSWLHGKYCGSHSTKCIITEQSNIGSTYRFWRIDAVWYWNTTVLAVYIKSLSVRRHRRDYIRAATDYYKWKCSSWTSGCLACRCFCGDWAYPYPLLSKFAWVCFVCVCVSVSGTAGWNVWCSIAKCHKWSILLGK